MPKINVYLPDDLAEAVKAASVSVSPVCQAALRQELQRMETIDRLMENMTDIEIEVGAGTRVFEGRWLVHPDEDETRAEGPEWDAGAYYGVALTARGRIAVYASHVNEMWPAVLTDWDDLDDVPADMLPDNIRQLAGAELGENSVIRLDI